MKWENDAVTVEGIEWLLLAFMLGVMTGGLLSWLLR